MSTQAARASSGPRPTNPYIAGRPLKRDRAFYGRDDILKVVESEIATPERNAVVLFGQRRIGKTSILLYLLRHLAKSPYCPVYFDLMDRAYKSLGRVLFDLASTIGADTGVAPGSREEFDDNGRYFQNDFLPRVYETLQEDRRLVLLFDEFDVLDVAAEQRLDDTSAARAFFPYLRKLMSEEERIAFIFVVGRKAEDLSIDVKATFKAARHKRVSVLDEASARDLVTTAERQGSLRFAAGAVERILALTSGHPYFTQLVCQLIWDQAHAEETDTAPLVDIALVDGTIPRVLEAGEQVFEWIWDGLPPAERVIAAATASTIEEHDRASEEQIIQILQRDGIRILTGELELAPKKLVDWEVLRATDGGYQYFNEIMRRWIVDRKPLRAVKDEIDRVEPHAENLFRGAEGFYRAQDLESAKDLCERAIKVNPNHVRARLLLADVLMEQDDLDEAIKILKEAHGFDEAATRYPLVKALMIQAEQLERTEKHQDALGTYEEVLRLSPHDSIARERIESYWQARGDEAIASGALEDALAAFEKAGATEDAQRARALLQEKKELRAMSEGARGAFERENLTEAISLLTNIIVKDPLYEDAAELLVKAVRRKKASSSPETPLQSAPDTTPDEQDLDATTELSQEKVADLPENAIQSMIEPPSHKHSIGSNPESSDKPKIQYPDQGRIDDAIRKTHVTKNGKDDSIENKKYDSITHESSIPFYALIIAIILFIIMSAV